LLNGKKTPPECSFLSLILGAALSDAQLNNYNYSVAKWTTMFGYGPMRLSETADTPEKGYTTQVFSPLRRACMRMASGMACLFIHLRI
jgi:hypothetical protein